MAVFERCMKLLRLSKKSEKWITAFLALLKINNLQVIETKKMAKIRVFRQARYLDLFPDHRKCFDIDIIY